MILKSLIAVAILAIAAVLILAATRPDTIRLERSVTIAAPPERVFPLLNDFHRWPLWAPQDRDDSTMTRTYSGAQSGTGAISDWRGSGNSGTGRMTIVDSTPNTLLAVQVDFAKPFEAHNHNRFVLEPEGASTRVTWSMQGSNLYMMKVMGVFTDMDRMMGKHFEAGLQNLKTVAEQAP